MILLAQQAAGLIRVVNILSQCHRPGGVTRVDAPSQERRQGLERVMVNNPPLANNIQMPNGEGECLVSQGY